MMPWHWPALCCAALGSVASLLESLPENLPAVAQAVAQPAALAPRIDGEPTLAIGLFGGAPDVRLHSPGPLVVDFWGTAGAAAQGHVVPPQALQLRAIGSQQIAVEVGGKALPSASGFVYLRSPQGHPIQIDAVPYGQGYAWAGKQARRYCGELVVVAAADGTLTVVNHVGAETLLEGVVPAEMPASAPLEALKAQAVAARSTLFTRTRGRHPHMPYTLCAEQHCQVYAGVGAGDPRSHQAIAATRGEVLRRAGRPFDAVYSANCGGFSEDNDAVWGDAPHAALRHRSDFLPGTLPAAWRDGIGEAQAAAYVALPVASFCAAAQGPQAQRFRWQRHFTRAELAQLTAARWPQLGALRDVQVVGRGAGGRVTTLRLVGEGQHVDLSRELCIRRSFGNLQSAAFVVQRQRGAAGSLQGITFVGAGWGHGVGMCQSGAMGRARAGQSYREILAHYYSGAQPVAGYGGAPPPR